MRLRMAPFPGRIWFPPRTHGLKPGYQQRPFPESELHDNLRAIVSPEGIDWTYAELTAAEKDRHSHRAQAVRALWPRVRARLGC